MDKSEVRLRVLECSILHCAVFTPFHQPVGGASCERILDGCLEKFHHTIMWERENDFEELLEKGIKKNTQSSIDEVVALAIDEEKWVKYCPGRDSKYTRKSTEWLPCCGNALAMMLESRLAGLQTCGWSAQEGHGEREEGQNKSSVYYFKYLPQVTLPAGCQG